VNATEGSFGVLPLAAALNGRSSSTIECFAPVFRLKLNHAQSDMPASIDIEHNL